jgi:endonuclease/exonuclease/phosphatase family metal-dependent hydrolase
VFLVALGMGCAQSGERESRAGGVGPERITVMTWNAQAFFDAEESGSEFDEFKGPKSAWSPEKYAARLDRLREAILMGGSALGAGPDRGPDIVALEEIESARVIDDLCNRLPQRCRYANVAFVPPGKGASFASAVLSRYPIRSVSAHSVAVSGIALRPLLEVSIDADGLAFSVFSAHWKSKVGDDDTAAVRLAQEGVLSARISALESGNPEALYVACGDFNQSLADFSVLGRGAIASPWPEWLSQCVSGLVQGPEGSYYYDGTWEAIDHFFYPADARSGYRAREFRVLATPPLTDGEAHPSRYEVFSGRGYSDHLPLLIAFTRVN